MLAGTAQKAINEASWVLLPHPTVPACRNFLICGHDMNGKYTCKIRFIKFRKTIIQQFFQ